ncbi:MAG: hypothetical protein SWX82_27930 [Cyanobacteriota bacterium]|nr:hypothetical protein [Cyanobacteriota bacterium]
MNFHSIAVCSDTKVGKNKRKSKNDDMADITVNDLAFPPTTNAQDIIEYYHAFNPPNPSLKGKKQEKSPLKGGRKKKSFLKGGRKKNFPLLRGI